MKVIAYKPRDEGDVLLIGAFQSGDELEIAIVDDDGDRAVQGNILSIGPHGVALFPCVDEKHGLPLDSEGRVRLFP